MDLQEHLDYLDREIAETRKLMAESRHRLAEQQQLMLEQERRWWLPWLQALAALVVAGVVFIGVAVAVSKWLPPLPQSITVHIVGIGKDQ